LRHHDIETPEHSDPPRRESIGARLFFCVDALATTDAIKCFVTERALAGRAPYHRAENSVADAILIEVYADMVKDRKDKTKRFAFVTHNSKDFSEPNGDRRKPHPDLSNLFWPPRSTYWGSLVDLVKDVGSELLADHDSKLNLSQRPRRLSEILEAENVLFRQVWYNRHWNLRTEIEEGKHQVLPGSEYSRHAIFASPDFGYCLGKSFGGG
jgi:hypothetical protein